LIKNINSVLFFDTVDILEKDFLLVNGHCLSDEFEEYWWKTLLEYPHSQRLYANLFLVSIINAGIPIPTLYLQYRSKY